MALVTTAITVPILNALNISSIAAGVGIFRRNVIRVVANIYIEAVADPSASVLDYFSHRDFVIEVIRIERIDPPLRGFRLRIHKIHYGFVRGSG